MRAEVERRLVHATGAAFPLAYALDLLPYAALRLLLSVAVAVAAVLEALRLSGRVRWAFFDRLTREYERSAPAGYALYLLSMAAVAWLFAPDAAIPAMLMLALGDPVSGLLSTGGLRPAKRGFVLLAMFGVCTLLALPFVGSVPAIAGAAAATLADGVKPVVAGYVVDDNLTIPPAAALAITLATTV
ncbi:dolichol kinase [Halosegnis marinus]|uniref:Dolichol kinase n=1 Tax=Halosegnis marinus TaxID=3034023 RepID=A0ABD5ZNI5_9EURY|nr:dolichol kinase [Halosegnis sp. DT85]